LETGNFEEAEDFFKKAEGMLPIYSDAKNNLGVLYYRTNREAEAAQVWKEVVRKDPEYFTAWYNLGLVTMSSGDTEKAEEYFTRAIREQKDFSPAKIQLAKINLMKGDKNEAKKLSAAAFAKSPDNDDIWSLHSYILVQTGDTSGAVNILLKKVPAAAALKMLGEIYAVKGDFAKARSYLESLKTNTGGRDSGGRDFYETLAAVYNGLKLYKKSEELFLEAERNGDRISLAFWITFAWALYEQNQKDRAIMIFTQKSALFPENKYLKTSLIYALINDNKFDEAKKILDEMSKADADNFSIEYLKGFAALSSKQYEESKKSLEKALKLSPGNKSAKVLLAFVLINMGDEKNAERLWREVSKADTLNSQSFINLAVLSETRNKPDSALFYYKKALKIEENAGVRVSMGNIYSEKKQYDLAMTNYKAAFDSLQWRTKALAGGYFAALGLKDTAYADKIALLMGVSDTGDYVIRVLSDHAYRKGDLENSRKLALSISKPLAEDYLRLGWVYLGQENIKLAEVVVDSAVSLKADESETARLRQQIAFAKGDYGSALSFKDNSPTGIYNRSVILYRNKDYAQALNQAVLAADLFSGTEKIEMIRIAANSASSLKDYKAALRWFSLLNQLEPNAQNALNAAIAAYNENNVALTKEFYLSAKERDGGVYNKDIELRFAHEERPKEVETKVVFSSADSLYNAALNFHLSGDRDNAMKLYLELLQIQKDHYRAWNNLGAIYGERGEIDSAVQAYENAVSRRADIIDGYVNLVNIYSATGDKDNAKKWLRKGLKVDPKNNNLLFFKKQLGE
jgi:pentatricopeptide repeat protein